MINYKKLSYRLGLHKDSMNFIQGGLSTQRARSIYKLRQLYNSVDPVHEEEEQNKSAGRVKEKSGKSPIRDASKSAHKKAKTFFVNSVNRKDSILNDEESKAEDYSDTNSAFRQKAQS